MQSITGGDAGTWATIIQRESSGNMDANNSTHFGLFQSDTAYIGMTLEQECANAKEKYDSQGFAGAWLNYE
ncbi:hypothetical protein D7I46_01165 [Lactococcus allomyrinae]|uniref:Transglycosylase SLT domain-containing protein n=2 Tax=Lactococcus allomyrinae TaxID=2419773 RepID=A0A387B7P9_9LACT|nr:hypothetical protein D7I46_01165 [Lactococcus allomyrinae]